VGGALEVVQVYDKCYEVGVVGDGPGLVSMDEFDSFKRIPEPKVEKKSDWMPGDHIKVKVGGISYDTVITTDGVQRFVENSAVRWLIDKYRPLNDLNCDFQCYPGKISKRDYLEFNMMLGYSVCGLAELSEFERMKIVNPVWEEEAK
jgi:hypothetical protein